MTTPAKLAKEITEIVRTVVSALLIALVLRVFLFQPFTIPSDSMEPGLRDGDYIVVSKFSYGFSRYSIPFSPPLFRGRILGRRPERGDVIVFKLPRAAGRIDYIKRLIGLPGDWVQVLRGVIYVNGKAVPHKPLGIVADPDNPARLVQAVQETPAGHRYVTFSETPAAPIENTGVYVVPPGQYFFMGDNRDNSLDSRVSGDAGVGLVPADMLVGKAQLILVSWRGASLIEPWTWITRLDPQRCLRRIG